MTTHPMRRIDVLIFAIDPSMECIAPDLIRPPQGQGLADDRAVRVVGGAGEALRLIRRHEPSLLFVLVGHERLTESAALIESLRRHRPRLPLLAITPEHDDVVERAVRAAGAGYYFSLDAEASFLQGTLRALGFASVPSATRFRRPRIRGRPQSFLGSS